MIAVRLIGSCHPDYPSFTFFASNGRRPARTSITVRQSDAIKCMEEAVKSVQTALARVEHVLLSQRKVLIDPLFALANAGVG